ncbi:MAG: transglycosylase SLT domain-containing protein [Bacteroidetes bacterium]|nr:transglycosylase SLT domain-containing protein [Bacteroidota bacterium]MBU1717991.1 transglycosylase SLT domain-containing protein [Bacteroidota bacterium]
MKNFRFLMYSLLVSGLFYQPAAAQEEYTETPEDPPTGIISDDPILEMIDSLATSRYFECSDFTTDTAILNIYHFAPDSVPDYSDEVYASRISKLNATSPFPFEYNETVKKYIDFYAFKKRNYMSRMLGLAELYFPLFEETLDKYQIPLEIKYLAIVESALNPFAVSRAKAAGLWQFMYKTGKMYDMRIDSYIDERYDPYRETIAACEYMQDMYNMYGDWALVLASYNAGPGNVNKAIRRSGGKTNFWDIMAYLPKETQGYVPAYIAVSYVMNYSSEHNIYPLAPRITYHSLDTLMIHQELKFDQIAAILDISEDELRFLNPSYKKNIIPYAGDPMRLVLPNELIGDFINNQDTIFNWSPVSDPVKDKLLVKLDIAKDVEELPNGNVKKTHIVKKGEYVSLIARNYGVSAESIKTWNNLKTNYLKVGQKLIVYLPESEVEKEKKDDPNANDVAESKTQETKSADTKKTIIHTIQKGDTLWDIANRYRVSIDMIKKWNNITNVKGLKPGDRIKIQVG